MEGCAVPPLVVPRLRLRRFAPGSRFYAGWKAFFEAIGAVWTAVLLAVELFWAFGALNALGMPGADVPETSVKAIGLRLFQNHALAFEATSLLILVAKVGAVILARKEPQ